jgi:hypothetical protein
LPTAEAASPLFGPLGIDEVDRADVLAALSTIRDSPAWRWLFERAYHQIQLDVGNPDAMRRMPNVAVSLGVVGRCFWIVVFVTAVDLIRNWHAAHGISDEISWATLADLGRHMRLYRQRNAATGLDTHWWIALHFRGGLFAIGRLQYAPYRLLTGPAGPLFWYDEEAAAARAPGFARGDPAIGLHIPESGPLTPSACADSFAAAREFFRAHFPEFAGAVVTCTSWLMDDQLVAHLDGRSNIVQFQQRFELVPGTREADAQALHFVFGRGPDTPIDELRPETTLERAIVRHIKEGGHWHMRTGWLWLETGSARR